MADDGNSASVMERYGKRKVLGSIQTDAIKPTSGIAAMLQSIDDLGLLPEDGVEDRRGEHWASKVAATLTGGFSLDKLMEDFRNPFTARSDRGRDYDLEKSQLAKDAGIDLVGN